MSQLTLSFEPALPERFPSLREYVAHRSSIVPKHLKVQAADMDMAPSTLSRKLHPHDGDTQRFNLDDLEAWLASTGDAAAVVEYLAAKYLDSNDALRERLACRTEALLSELAQLMPSLRAAA